MKNIKKYARYLPAVTMTFLFFLCILIPLALSNHKPNQISELDNTSLMEWHEVTSGPFTEKFEQYVTERIGLRNSMIDKYINLNDRLFHILEHPTYTYGRDGYVFFNMPNEKNNPSYLKAFASFINRMEKYLTDNDIYFLYCINPNKTQVYADYLPAGANLTFARQKLLAEYLDKYNINYIDNTDLLVEASKETAVFDKKYDAGHWNENGAYIGINNILTTLSLSFPDIPVNTLSDYNITEVVREKLPLSNFVINEPSLYFERNNAEAVDVTADDTDIILDENYRDYSHYINPEHPELPKILVFRGSYFLGKEKFMNESFSESVFVHSYYNIFNLQYYVEKFKPDIVLFESVEYATINKYFPKDMLKNTTF